MATFKVILAILLASMILIIGFWAFNPTTAPSWTGFGPYDQNKNGPQAKTLWDWLDLLVVPSFLAVGAFLLSEAQKDSERKNELDRQRQNTLSSFIDQISTLLLEKKLRSAKIGAEIRSVARTYSRAALRSLDGKRKAEALQFLSESGLIFKKPIISLIGADLTESQLSNANLLGAEIKGARLDRSVFKDANLSHCDLTGCNLSNTNFEHAILEGTNLSYTILKHANLRNTDLTNTNLDWAELDEADLRNSKITKEQIKKIASAKNTKFSKQQY